MPGYEPRPQRVAKISMQIHYPLSYHEETPIAKVLKVLVDKGRVSVKVSTFQAGV